MSEIFARLRLSLLPAGCLALALWLGWHATMGQSGLLAWGGYRAERAALERQAADVAARKAALEHRVALLDPRKVDPDLADELVRGELGLVRPDEVVVPLPEAPAR